MDIERRMVRAIQRKDIESVNLHIKFGADPSLGLTAALQIHDSRIFKLLLKRGRDTDCIVPSKARASLMAAIEAGNRNFVDLLLEACRASDLLGNVNFVHGEWTPLMIAVRHDNEYIARRLIRNGAKPNIATRNGDSLTIARQNKFHDMLQILLEGTRISHPLPESRVCRDEISPQTLRSTHGKVERDAQWLNDDQPNTEEQQHSLVRRLNKIKFRNMRLEFRKQHTKILACAEASVKAVDLARRRLSDSYTYLFKTPYARPKYQMQPEVEFYPLLHFDTLDTRAIRANRAWGFGFDADYSKAWSSGTNFMRNLLAGKLSSSLNDTIMFLAIARAMCLSGSAPVLSTWYSDFASDVGRWQMLFKSENGDLLAFQEAVSSVWGISIEQLKHVNSPDSEALASFQELAVILADNAELSLGLREHDHGLIASQKRWRSRNKPRVPGEHQHDLVRQESWAFIHEVQAYRQPEKNPTRRPPDNHNTQDPETSIPIWHMCHTDPKVYTFSLTAILLMAGFIFGVVLTFLLGKNID